MRGYTNVMSPSNRISKRKKNLFLNKIVNIFLFKKVRKDLNILVSKRNIKSTLTLSYSTTTLKKFLNQT